MAGRSYSSQRLPQTSTTSFKVEVVGVFGSYVWRFRSWAGDLSLCRVAEAKKTL